MSSSGRRSGVIQRYPVATGRPELTRTATRRGSQSGVGRVSASMKATTSSSGVSRSSAASRFHTFCPAPSARPAIVTSSRRPRLHFGGFQEREGGIVNALDARNDPVAADSPAPLRSGRWRARFPVPRTGRMHGDRRLDAGDLEPRQASSDRLRPRRSQPDCARTRRRAPRRPRMSWRPSPDRPPAPASATPPRPSAVGRARPRASPRRSPGRRACRRNSRYRPACRSGRGRRD